LINVDLRSEAAELLQHLVQYRLKGSEQADAGARLAEVLLLDRKPMEALAALERTDAKELAAELSERRRHLRATALLDAGRFNDALARIAGDLRAECDRVPAQVYSRGGAWQQAARARAPPSERLDPARPQGP